MTFCRKSLVSVVLSQLLIVVSLGQTPAVGQKSTLQSNSPLPERVQRALKELEEVLALAREIDDSAVRITLQARAAADVMWRIDEQRARQMLTMASSAITAPPATDSPIRSESFSLLMDVLMRAHMKDPALMESILQTAIGEETHPGAWRSYRALILLDAASSLKSGDPKRAARLGMAGYDVLPADFRADTVLSDLLNSLRPKDPDLSDQVFDHAISVLSRQPERALRTLPFMARYVFPDFPRPPAPASTPQSSHLVSLRYLELVHDAAAQLTTELPTKISAYSELLTSLLPYFERYAPGKRVSLEKMLEPVAPRDVPSTSAPTAVESLTPLEGLSNPAPTNAELERAAKKALGENQFEKALTIGRRITDEVQRSRAIQEVLGTAAHSAMGQGDLEATILYAREISRPDLRAYFFSRVIDLLRGQKQEPQAFDLLDEAWRWNQESPRGQEKTEGMLRLAGEAAVARSPGAFQLMEASVDEINLMELHPVWQKVIVFDDAATGGQTRFTVDVGVARVVGNFGRGFGALSRMDFDKAMMLARKIRMKEVSVFARLAVCYDALFSYRR